MPPNNCGGDQHRGAATPQVIAARTPVETGALPCPGTAKDTAQSSPLITTHPLWPLVVTLGEIARRVSQRAHQEQNDVA